ncbi:glycoside hydrolase family 3 N-terminal domain-containing protein [Draconibacterium sp. IB214405]|uniref:glycoside hydrolase family 3 N-terminal domain-containing protein n=1 Tax=Draconibacterium sp. IB214405 TaxID=3097352 RepID=UPI002A12E110|nr:glycoside hydrolase family 3 N-terminal domain-containing protein [Draconibacterium sp. IB214405]MDX8337564.1 glycoside hydrolase family 3 N-terminal domain-containing protein [Draconibacterium sp. IB214405]
MKIRILSLIAGIGLLAGCSANSTHNADPVEEKINSMLSGMTLEEKIGQMQQVNDGFFGDDEATKQAIREGKVGSFLNMVDAKRVAEFQRVALEESKHGIPLLFGRDVIHGFRTIFPIPLGMASSWEPDLAEKAMRIAAVEASSMGINWTFAPMMDVTWDPRWGRIAESCGEDPLLAAEFAAAMVKGFQGDLSDPTAVAACAKHFVGYGMSEAGRDYNTTYIPEPLLRNVHLRPFKAAADAGVLTFMSAFNDLNGVPTSGNEFTLKQILRDEWDYKGMVVSDWGSIPEMINHGFAADTKQAAEIAAKAGVDMEMATTCYAENLKTLVEEGVITETQIDNYVGNILRVKQDMGLFEKPYDNHVSTDTILAPTHLEVSREVARKSMVLLKNKGNTLPISKSIRSLAVIGPLSDAGRDQLGTWIFDGQGEDSTTPKEAFEKILGSRMNYAEGLEYSRDKSTKGFAKAIAAAKRSDAIIFFAGEESILSGEANARGIIDLPGVQTELITELKKTGKPLILVVMAGRPLGIGAEMDMADAVLYAWHPGTMAGPAITDLVFGDYSPSGKLPVTFVKGAGQIPFYYYRKNTGRPATENDVTYIDDIPRNSKQLSLGFKSMHIDYGITPLLPFGFGLSYTEFEYNNLKLSAHEISADGTIFVSADIKNVGNYEAEEIVQLYIRDKVGSITRPIKELKGFKKINLKPGNEKTVNFELKAEDLQFFNGKEYVIEPGDFYIWIGPNSEEGLQDTFVLK